MRPLPELEKRYQSDAPFNALVNCFRNLLEQHGFVPSEIREAMFLAQYQFEAGRVEQIIRSEKEWEQIAKARELLKAEFAKMELKS